MKNEILVLTKYPRMGASSRLRTLQYLPLLEEKGFNFTVRSLVDDAYLDRFYNNSSRSQLAILKYYTKRLLTLSSIWRYDLIWIEGEIFPYLPAFAERFLKYIGKNYIVDYDDAIFHNYDLSNNFVLRSFLSKKIDVVMKNSSCVVVGNPYLATRAKIAGAKNIQLVPTIVDKSRYVLRPKAESKRKVIGWIGSPSTQKYILDIKEALHTICKRYSARLLLVGATEDIANKLQGIDVEIVAWSEDSENQLIQEMDIGIMPLSNGVWERGKCGYKLIQYMASGIPVVASPVGVNNDIINVSNCGYLADNTEQWTDSLDSLLSSVSHRKDFSKAGRKAVEEIYSLQVQVHVLEKILRSLSRSNAD